MAKRKKIPACAAKALLFARGVSLNADFHALRSSDVDIVLAVAKAAGYRKSKNAPGSRARMFYSYLARKRCG
jgi:hypothetical protein